ncbi:MAG: Crp/Fnr family transcriptional regulator, partial [Candidatus Binataceae bacterium]
IVRYSKGAELFAKGSPADVVFAILGGVAMVHSSCPDGDRVLFQLAGPGDLIGYADFTDPSGGQSQMFEAEALTDCRVALIARRHIMEVLAGLTPGQLLGVVQAINSMWTKVAYRYASFLGMSLRQRLEIVLADLARRFGVADARGIILPEIAQVELAAMIGSSRPMVSKLLGEMSAQGTLIHAGRRHLLLAAPHPLHQVNGASGVHAVASHAHA